MLSTADQKELQREMDSLKAGLIVPRRLMIWYLAVSWAIQSSWGSYLADWMVLSRLMGVLEGMDDGWVEMLGDSDGMNVGHSVMLGWVLGWLDG